MIIGLSITCSFVAFIRRLSPKLKLFKSFTGITIQELEYIYDKEISKRCGKCELKCLSKRKEDIKRKAGAIKRPFKFDLKKYISNAFGVPSSFHYLHIDRLSLI
jgi:hypothetical protein